MQGSAAVFDTAPLFCFLARFAARNLPPTVRFRNYLLVSRWADVADVLARDGDFRIAPVNAERIEGVMGPFILGMDRSEALFAQRIAVYDAMNGADFAPVRTILEKEPAEFLTAAAEHDGKIDVVNAYARKVAGHVAAALFGISGPSEADLLRVARAVFHETFLNLSNDETIRKTGRAAGQELKAWIAGERERRLTSGDLGKDVLGRLLERERAGVLSDAEVGHVLAGLLVGSIDTTATAVSNIVVEILSDWALAENIRRDLNDRRRLYGWCWEALRRRPHNPVLLREAVEGASIAGEPVPAGTRVVAFTLAAMQDERVFDSPAVLNPDRPPHLYMHFGRSMHQCAGRDVNALQIPALIAALMRFSPSGRVRVKNAGPFPDQFYVRIRSPQ
jgi:cytochrome P450